MRRQKRRSNLVVSRFCAATFDFLEVVIVSSKASEVACDRKNGSVALFMGKRAVEKAATWKSPTTGLSHSTWKSRNRSGISHFFHRATTADLLVRLFAVTKIAELRRTRLVCVCQNKD